MSSEGEGWASRPPRTPFQRQDAPSVSSQPGGVPGSLEAPRAPTGPQSPSSHGSHGPPMGDRKDSGLREGRLAEACSVSASVPLWTEIHGGGATETETPGRGAEDRLFPIAWSARLSAVVPPMKPSGLTSPSHSVHEDDYTFR